MKEMLLALLLLIIGFVLLIKGADFFVDGSSSVAKRLKVPSMIIGLTIVAMGTSLPECAVSVTASLNNNNALAVSNVIGSNIFNILLIFSLSSFINPIKYSSIFNQDLLILIGGTFFLFLTMFIGKKHQLERWQAFVFLCFYLGYTVFLVSKEM